MPQAGQRALPSSQCTIPALSAPPPSLCQCPLSLPSCTSQLLPKSFHGPRNGLLTEMPHFRVISLTWRNPLDYLPSPDSHHPADAQLSLLLALTLLSPLQRFPWEVWGFFSHCSPLCDLPQQPPLIQRFCCRCAERGSALAPRHPEGSRLLATPGGC